MNTKSNKKNKILTTQNLLIISFTLVIFIFVTIIFLPCPTNAQYIFFRIIISFAIAGLATTIPGIFSIKLLGIKTIGPIGILIFVYIYTPDLIDTRDKCADPFDLTVFLEFQDGGFIETQGTVVLKLGNDKRKELIDEDGSVDFKQIPNRFFDELTTIQLSNEGLQFINGKKIIDILLNENSKTFIVENDNSNCCLSGIIRNNKNEFIEGVVVQIAEINIITKTDDNGKFEIRIPREKQKDNFLLIVKKSGFRVWESIVYPGTKQEINIILNKKL
ncbi:MAG: hypothetical protein GY936_08380 [Ignavibacteriae bacterium]|nr:hypothetical protein [Ignavibacteriota bacterium]